MVLKFRLISNEQDEFIRDFKILADQSFFQFHTAIQENLHYDKSQIASFFICSQEWKKQQEITLFELSEEESANVLTMDNTIIGDHVHEPHDKMVYVFDVFNERQLFIELVSIRKKHNPEAKYPACSYHKGYPPQQLIMNQPFGMKSFSNGSFVNESYYGDDLNEDDFLYDEDILDE